MYPLLSSEKNINRLSLYYFFVRFVMILGIASLAINSNSQTIPIHFDKHASYQMLSTVKSTGGTSNDSSYDIQTTGKDPFIYSYNISQKYDPHSVYVISFDYSAPDSINQLQIYFGPPFSEKNSIKVGALPPSSSYKNFTVNIPKFTALWNQSYSKVRFDFGTAANKRISLRNIYLRKPTDAEVDQSINRNKEIVNYLNSNFPDKIKNVIVNKNKITIRGIVTETNTPLYLCEWRMFDDTKLVTNSFASVTPIDTKQPTFEVQTDRFSTVNDTGYDRIYSRWVIAAKNGSQYHIQSFAHFAENINGAAVQYLPEEKPENKKGISGFFTAETRESDLNDLQIKNVLVNLVLPGWISLSPTEFSYRFNGATYYFNPKVVNRFDEVFKSCSDKNIFVTGVILIPENIPENLKSIFVFSGSDDGVQSMANVTSVTGLNYYAAVIGFIAERYSRPDKKFGRISNYVVHNEVDNGQYWTNAGTTQMEYYTELYDHAMRAAYYTVRQYNPAAKVFISLTHSWAVASNPKFFSPRDLLEVFNKMTDEQGDYEWGLAFHPYPEDSFDPHTWNDKDATANINTTKYITPKNIELIDEWMRMKDHLYKGLKVRTLLFSEEGIHSKSYSKQDLLDQAAGVAYMWKKFNRLPTLEGFYYYAQADNKNEKGLKVGLWTTKAGTIATPDQKKTGWYVYQKAGTPSEDSAFAFALPIIGISNWSQAFLPLSNNNMPRTVTFNVNSGGTAVNNAYIYFNGEMHKVINGKAIFYNVASLPDRRNYRVEQDGRLIAPEQSVVVTKDQVIAINVSQ